MGEGLREVADLLPGGGDLLGIEAEVVPVGSASSCEGQARRRRAGPSGRAHRHRGTCTARRCPPGRGGHRVRPPGRSGTRGCRRRVSCPIAPTWSTCHLGSLGTTKPVSGIEHEGGVEDVTRPRTGRRRSEPVVPALGHDVCRGRGRALTRQRSRSAGRPPAVRHADGTVQRHPGHDLAVDEAAPATAGLPDALIGLLPVLAEPVDPCRTDVVPAVVADAPFAEPAGVPGRRASSMASP